MRIRALLALLCLASPSFPAESWKTRYESGLQLLDQGKYAEAQENFKAGIAENPGSSEIHNALGMVALQTGEPRAAVTSFERALELRPQDGKILYNLISAYLASNQPVPALQKTDQLLAGKTADPALYVQTGELLSRFGHVAHALQCYRAAEGKSDKTPEARSLVEKLVAEADAQIERDRQDIGRLEASLRSNPGRPEPYFQLGLMWIKLGQFSRSLELLEPAAARFSNSAEIRLAYALACYFTGHDEKAEAAYKQLVRMQPESDQAYFALGNFYADVGKVEDAAASFRRAAAKNFRKNAAERFRRKLRDFVEAAGGVKDGLARGVVNGQPEMQARSVGGRGFRIGDRLAQRGRHAVPAADDAEPHAFLDAVRRFREQVFVEQPQDGVHFGRRPLPVRGREREERQRVNAEPWRRFDNVARGFRSGTVAGGTRQPARSGPSAVAVGNDGHVQTRVRGADKLRMLRRSRCRWTRRVHGHHVRSGRDRRFAFRCRT